MEENVYSEILFRVLPIFEATNNYKLSARTSFLTMKVIWVIEWRLKRIIWLRIRTAFVWDNVVFFVLRSDIGRVTVFFSSVYGWLFVVEGGVAPASNWWIFVSGTTLPPLTSRESLMPVKMTSKWFVPHILKVSGLCKPTIFSSKYHRCNPLNVFSRKRFVSTRHVTQYTPAKTW